MIHTKSGKTYTDRDAYPWTLPAGEEITSVERNVNGKTIAVKASKEIHHIFVKASESKDIAMLVDAEVAHLMERPPVVEALAIGFHVGVEPNIYRIELECDPRNNNVLSHVVKVEKATIDGF